MTFPSVPETTMFANDSARLEATLTLTDLIEIYCVSKRTIWRWVAEDRIPRPYAITRRIRRWKANEIQQHLDGLRRTTRPAGSDAMARGLKERQDPQITQINTD